MLLLKVSILVVLACLFFQDIRSRMVYVFWFPVLAVLFIGLNWERFGSVAAIWPAILFNLGFLALQLLLLTVYFSLKKKSAVNITTTLIGWGDIMLLISCAFYFSAIGYCIFYLVAILLSLVIWVLFKLASGSREERIPLAGLQSMILVFLLTGQWFFRFFDLTNDDSLLHLIR